MGMDFAAVMSGLMKRGGGGGADFGKVKTGPNMLRFYRHPSWAPMQLFEPRVVHWPFGGQNTPCTGPTCEKCAQVQKLYAAGDKDSKDTAYQNRAQTRGIFAAVDVNEPNGIQIFELAEGTTKQVMAAVASAGGWTGDFPKGDPGDPEAAGKLKEFFEALAEGSKVACGPAGYDIAVTYTPKGGANKKASYTVQLMPKTPKTKVLPFEEAETPDIAEIIGKVAAKKKEAAQGG